MMDKRNPSQLSRQMKDLGRTKLQLYCYKVIIYIAIIVPFLFNTCSFFESPHDGSTGSDKYIQNYYPGDSVDLVIDYQNHGNPSVSSGIQICPVKKDVTVNWEWSDYGGGNYGSASVNPENSMTNDKGWATTVFTPGIYSGTYYGGNDFNITASTAEYGSWTSGIITLWKKMHIEVDYQTDNAPDLGWITPKFAHDDRDKCCYVKNATYIDDTDLTEEGLWYENLDEYAETHHGNPTTQTVYLCGVKGFNDGLEYLGFALLSTYGYGGWSFVAVSRIDFWYDPPTLDTMQKLIVVHELGHQIGFINYECANVGCIMYSPPEPEDTLFCTGCRDMIRLNSTFWWPSKKEQ